MADTAVPKPAGTITLHHLNSSQSLRILWALEELNLPYELKTYARSREPVPGLCAAFPLGNAPILEVDDPETLTYPKANIKTESRLILQYLADRYANGAWTPKSIEDKARNDYWQEFSGTTLASTTDFVMIFELLPTAIPFFLRPFVRAFCNIIVRNRRPALDKRYALMEENLSEDQPWFSGKEMGLADLCLSWPVDMGGQRGYIDAKKYPKVAEWHKRIHERPAYKRAIEKTPSYDLVTFDI